MNFGKDIRLEKAILERSNGVLDLLIGTVKRRKVRVRKNVHNVLVLIAGSKNIMNNDSCEREQHAGDFARVWFRSSFTRQ
jgi:hypothetical protein